MEHSIMELQVWEILSNNLSFLLIQHHMHFGYILNNNAQLPNNVHQYQNLMKIKVIH